MYLMIFHCMSRMYMLRNLTNFFKGYLTYLKQLIHDGSLHPRRNDVLTLTCGNCFSEIDKKYQGVKEFHMLARIGCYCNIMVFSPFKVKVTYYHPLNQWLIGATNGNQGQTVMHLQCSETINHS